MGTFGNFATVRRFLFEGVYPLAVLVQIIHQVHDDGDDDDERGKRKEWLV
jgi:hypothetical protein